MRIDVDVYKGPLANTPTIQKGQLDALLKATIPGLNDIDAQLVASMCRLGCVQRSDPDDFTSDQLKYVTLNYGSNFEPDSTPLTNKEKSSIPQGYIDNVLQPLTPSVTQCAQLGIPQRNALDHDAWFGKTHKPAEYEDRNGGKTYFENSVKLYDSMPRTKKACINKTKGEEGVCKGGIGGTLKRFVKPLNNKTYDPRKSGKPNEIEARIVENRTNRSSRYVRYPAWQEQYGVCPVYPRMRIQAAVIKHELLEHEENAFRFVKLHQQAEAIDTIETAYYEQLEGTLDKACKAANNNRLSQACNDHQAYGSALTAYSSALKAFKNTATKHAAAYVDTSTSLIQDSDKAAALLGYLNAASDLAERGGALQSAADGSLSQIKAFAKKLQQKTAITKLANTLKDQEDLFASAKAKPSLAEFDAAYAKVKSAQALSSSNAQEWGGMLQTLERERAKIAQKSGAAHAALKSALGQIETGRKGALSAYLSRKDIEVGKIKTSEAEFKKLNQRLAALKAPIAKAVPTAQMTAAQSGSQKKFDAAKTLETPQQSATPGPDDAGLKTLKEKLGAIKEIAENAKKIKGWENSAAIDGVIKQTADANTALNKAIAAKTWKEGSDDYHKTLDTALKAISAATFPSPIPSAAQASEFSTQVNNIKKLVDGSPETDKFATLLAQSIVYSRIDESAAQLKSIRLAVAADGLSTEENELIASLDNASGALEEHKKVIAVSLKAVSGALARAKQVQDTNEDVSYATIAGLAGGFRVLATAISYQIASVDPNEKRLRIDLLKAANSAAEFANQLTSRANALDMQQHIDARLLSTGQYLRDAKPTAFLDAYDWLDAATDGSATPRRERIETAKQLFDDDNWANVNEVYASGVGKTAMAFIRDDIGNWNLKSFDNDPSELTGAYANLGVSLVEKAASLAASGGTVDAQKIDSIKSLMQSAQSAETGALTSETRAGALISGLDLEAFRKELHDELAHAQERLVALEKLAKEHPDNEDIERERERVMASALITATRYRDLVTALQRVSTVAAKQKADDE